MGFKNIASVCTDFTGSIFLRRYFKSISRSNRNWRYENRLPEFTFPAIAETAKEVPQYDVVFIGGDHRWPAIFVTAISC